MKQGTKLTVLFFFLENFIHSYTPCVKNRNDFVFKSEPTEPTEKKCGRNKFKCVKA